MKKILTLTLLATLPLSGCVKLKILPDGSIQEGIQSTQRIYDESKIKRSGGEKRHFSREEIISQYPSREAAEESCIQSLKQKLATESPGKAPVIKSEYIKLVPENEGAIQCNIEAYIWAEN